MPKQRIICEYPGCKNLTINKGYRNGRKRYTRFCNIHIKAPNRPQYTQAETIYTTKTDHIPQKRKYHYKKRGFIPNDKCEICQWTKGPCDRHRIIPSRGYTRENIIVVCPNCHRLITFNLIPNKRPAT